ncbi:hypothetical protein DXG01_016405 [Tephrocybe rancida]|nr:hypothetical protein DXG01_016405 [Tephrocybe rancida]
MSRVSETEGTRAVHPHAKHVVALFIREVAGTVDIDVKNLGLAEITWSFQEEEQLMLTNIKDPCAAIIIVSLPLPKHSRRLRCRLSLTSNLTLMIIALGLQRLATRAIDHSSSFEDLVPASSCDNRTLSGIAWSCLTTIFACTWIAIHPNIPKAGERPIVRRFKTFILALIAPELMVAWASRQWFSSRQLARKYKEYGWTQTHGFFAIMGGFKVYESDNTRTASNLDPASLTPYLEKHQIAITKDEIMDKSKGDLLSKSLVLLQVSWFILQFLARAIQRLAITELELVTVAFAILNFMTYFFWWNKPLDVQYPVMVKISSHPTDGDIVEARTDPSTPPRIFIVEHGTGRTEVHIPSGEGHPNTSEYDHVSTQNNLLATSPRPPLTPTIGAEASPQADTDNDLRLRVNALHRQTAPSAIEDGSITLTEDVNSPDIYPPSPPTAYCLEPPSGDAVNVDNPDINHYLILVPRMSTLHPSDNTQDLSMTISYLEVTPLTPLPSYWRRQGHLGQNTVMHGNEVGRRTGCFSCQKLRSDITGTYHKWAKFTHTMLSNTCDFLVDRLMDFGVWVIEAVAIFESEPDADYQAYASGVLTKGERLATEGLTCVTAVIFGATHCLAWHFDFPTKTEGWLWRASSIIIAVAPTTLSLVLLRDRVSDDNDDNLQRDRARPRVLKLLFATLRFCSNISLNLFTGVILFLIAIYPFARLLLLVEIEPTPLDALAFAYLHAIAVSSNSTLRIEATRRGNLVPWEWRVREQLVRAAFK